MSELTQLLADAPKVLLHDHLDGGLRAGTVLELAAETGHELPESDPVALARWFRAAADSGSLDGYLEAYSHTVAVMQTLPALHRVARECVLDLAADAVVYAEVRFAPELHLENGLTPPEVVDAVLRGFADGERQAAERGRKIAVRALLTAMRHAAPGREIAHLAVDLRDQGVVGFDIAGAEAGYPPARYLEAFDYLHEQNFPVTIHAGEAFGLPSIWEAVQVCGADRLGHGVRITDDLTIAADGTVRLGRLASWVRDRRIALELCPSSNLQTGAAATIAQHPITLLKDLGFRVTVNTDGRLMSVSGVTEEMRLLVTEAGWSAADLRWTTVNAMKSAFAHYDERLHYIQDVIKPAWDEIVRRCD